MKVSSQVDLFYDNEMHIEKILHLPSLVAQSQNLMRRVPDEFQDVLEGIWDSRHPSMEMLWQFFEPKKSFCEIDGEEIDEDDHDPDPEDDLMNLQSMHGYWDVITECQFLVLFHKAKRYYHSKTSWSSGGVYYVQWITAPTIAKAMQEGKKWAKQMDERDLADMRKE